LNGPKTLPRNWDLVQLPDHLHGDLGRPFILQLQDGPSRLKALEKQGAGRPVGGRSLDGQQPDCPRPR
jgi:hypothetical protein